MKTSSCPGIELSICCCMKFYLSLVLCVEFFNTRTCGEYVDFMYLLSVISAVTVQREAFSNVMCLLLAARGTKENLREHENNGIKEEGKVSEMSPSCDIVTSGMGFYSSWSMSTMSA